MFSGQPCGKAAGVFSFGVVLWEVMTLKEPWRCANCKYTIYSWRYVMTQT
jgi:hypothetical protein